MAFTQALSTATSNVASRIATTGGGCLVQVWLPSCEPDGSISLATMGQPYSISGLGDHLALFRCVSCKYRFATTQESGALHMGAVGRVYASGEPEMSHDVQQYDKAVFQRVEEAVKCRVHAALFMPLYTGADREYPVAVFETVQATKNVLFPALIDLLIASLQGTGLYTSDISRHAMAVGLQPGACATGQQQQLTEGDALRQRTSGTLLDVTGATVQHDVADAAAALGVPESPGRRGRPARSESLSCESSLAPGKKVRLSPTMSQELSRQLKHESATAFRSQRVRGPPAKLSLLSAGSSELPSTSHSTRGTQSEERLPLGAGKRLTLEQLQAQFGYGLKQAARNLDICPTTLKRACRRLNIKRWPRRPKDQGSPAKSEATHELGDVRTMGLPQLAVSSATGLSAQSPTQRFQSGSTETAATTVLLSDAMMHMPAATMRPLSIGPVVTLPEIPGGIWPSMSLPALLPAGGLHGGIDHLLPSHASGHQDLGLDGLPACCTSGPPCLHASFAPGLVGSSAAGQQMPLLRNLPHSMQHGAPTPGPQLLPTSNEAPHFCGGLDPAVPIPSSQPFDQDLLLHCGLQSHLPLPQNDTGAFNSFHAAESGPVISLPTHLD